MPGYYQRPMAGQQPLTPPDSGSGYGYSNMHYGQDPYSQVQSQCRSDCAYDYQPQSYMQPAVAPAPPTYQYQPNSYQSSTSLPPISNFYDPLAAPILPPLRIQDRMSFTDDYQQRLQQEQQQQRAREQQRQAAKEEKATGGVSAHLDYEMESMTDFVTQAVTSMYAYHLSPISLADIDMSRSFQLRQQTSPQFRKWVHQVLSATRLPAATILLSLYYLNDRMIRFPDTVHGGDNEIYRLLAVALILGSKFLDDNTFINRSWSDVTAIKVVELNKLEAFWLEKLEWRLHIDPSVGSATGNSFKSWSQAWESHQSKMVAKQLPARLSPLNTNLHRSSHAGSRSDRYSPYPSPYTASSTRSFEQPQPLSAPLSARSSQYSTPYSSVDPWAPNTRKIDDYYKQSARYDAYAAEVEEANRRAEERARQSAYQYASNVHQAYYQQTPPYSSGWDTSSWNHHRYDCGCQTCVYQQHYRNYATNSSYAAQPVVG
ncbi:Putative cyclin PHO80, Cyclin-like superfamily [Septoria linicola]|uniref:Cyclin PHO80, Cyclin-like superfamily n=1 Tax=Septoria linicola TaxID=215465 RepID=A0A9Q9EKR6_9PEZI|nr:Putative cyclin PHO80, Cyclin-like superfamily [Septoria linicola]